ncbi:T9SS type B sorting domain-containing protein [Chitinophaga pinensis]|nr:gliding motility-associated C-terminal domain-containing protein [Chitinophaga pinensis]
MQRRVGLVLTDMKKLSDHCLFMLLFIVGMAWLPAKASSLPAGKTDKSSIASGVKPYTKSAQIWMTYGYTPSGTDQAVATGDRIDYRIYIRNTGDEPLTGVRIVDTIPLHTTFFGATNGGGLNGGLSNNILTYNNVTIPVGATIYVNISVDVAANLTGVDYINNTGYVDLGDGAGLRHTFGPGADNNITAPLGGDRGWPSTRTPVDNGMNTVAWKSSGYIGTGPDRTIQTGDVITYVIHVKNTGSQTLTNILVTDYVPVYTNFYDGDENVTPDANNLLSWTIPSLDPGQTTVRTFRVRVATDLTGAKSIDNTAYVNNGNGKGSVATLPALSNDPSQPDPGGLGKPSTTIPIKSVTSFESWKIVLNSSGETSVNSGEELSYIIYVRNTGNITIPLLQVSDPVPDFTTFQSASDGGLHFDGSNTVVWAVNNLAAGAIATLHFKVKVGDIPEGIGSINNTARVQIGGNSDSTSKPTYHCDPKEAGCDKGTVTSIKAVKGKPGLMISNVVTPNGDGKNDYFFVRGIDKFPNTQLFVFNRWGGVVYQSKDYQNNWNATGLSEGTYYYRLELNDPATGVTVYKGWVMIIR